MRLLHVFAVNEVGGAENVVLNFIRFPRDLRIQHHAVVLAETGGPLGERLTELGVPWRRVDRGRMLNPFTLSQALRGLRRVLSEARPDWILANSPQGHLYGRLAALGTGARSALYYMTVPAERVLRNGPLDILLTLVRPDLTLTASHLIARRLQKWGLSSVEAVHHGTIPPACDDQQRRLRDEILENFRVPAGAPLIVFPGRLQRWKGQHVLIDAMPAVLASVPEAQAVLIGGTLFGHDPEYPEELRRQIAGRGLQDRVHLVGHQPVAPWLERAAVVVHASTTADPFPNVCLEALACARPLVTNTLSGTCEIVEDHVQALITEPRDPAALARALVAVLQDPAFARCLGLAGRARFEQVGTADLMVHRLESALTRRMALEPRPRANV